jgi:hypothetical protein
MERLAQPEMDLATACLCSIKPKTIRQRLGGKKNTLEILFREKKL